MKEKLKVKNSELSEATTESLRLIQKEVEKIVSKDIKDFTYQAFGEVDENFWIAPASSSGKYHPPEDNGEGGLVRHVIKGMAVIEQYARRARFSQRELDEATSAFLLHDTCKNGIVWTTPKTDYTHGLIASEWLEKFDLEPAAKVAIQNAVRFHMAPWCYAVSPYEDRPYTKEEMNKNLDELTRAMYPTRVEKAVQEADYWSSRQSMSYFPGVAVDIRHDADR
ncbi:MAG: hypothetical protein ACD_61C00271G0004 [uncultured bacterium]|uniref:HD domain-containing protein n=2 Tax=Microgenomates group TaxID=1794810 RepID=A0A0G1LEA2_9BACT|nr:MAG: hypothetical protein ACD_61C00271G0004 [uncultured bacterium]KKT30924.1 MAG: hypothetical protein UW16_C0003G0017 [Microgenomates group bacterium GW2011_GWC1_44_10]KKT48770.1 MAG: hypothetical protein UW41_C0019G0020 [Candidatus Collierbacteria bacterium GW2011_GWC2_44_18]KKT67052.1 MAG: hypothetical protein UW60_C0014G0016 [Candidatus Woesebacteria bacterium GW2011_GWA2_44_33]